MLFNLFTVYIMQDLIFRFIKFILLELWGFIIHVCHCELCPRSLYLHCLGKCFFKNQCQENAPLSRSHLSWTPEHCCACCKSSYVANLFISNHLKPLKCFTPDIRAVGICVLEREGLLWSRFLIFLIETNQSHLSSLPGSLWESGKERGSRVDGGLFC